MLTALKYSLIHVAELGRLAIRVIAEEPPLTAVGLALPEDPAHSGAVAPAFIVQICPAAPLARRVQVDAPR
jgi:hypothetical protein